MDSPQVDTDAFNSKSIEIGDQTGTACLLLGECLNKVYEFIEERRKIGQNIQALVTDITSFYILAAKRQGR